MDEYKIKNESGQVEDVKPGTTFQMRSGAQFRMLATGSLIRVDRARKMNKKERRKNREIVRQRTEELRLKVEAYENATCICGHKRTTHKNGKACLGCTCAAFVEDKNGRDG